MCASSSSSSCCSHGDCLKLFKSSQPYLKPSVDATLIFYQRHVPPSTPCPFFPAILSFSDAPLRSKYSSVRAVSKDTSNINPVEVRGKEVGKGAEDLIFLRIQWDCHHHSIHYNEVNET